MSVIALSFFSAVLPEVTSLVAQMVKNLPAVQETQVQPLGQEDPLEKEMATHFSILAGKSYRQRNLVGYMGSQRVGQWLSAHMP